MNKTKNNLLANKKIDSKFLLMFVVLAVCLLGGKLFLFDTPLKIFGYSAYVITSGSMEPDYPVKSLVVIKSGGYEDLKEGDVIAFYSEAMGGNIAFHRIIRAVQDGYYTKGDKNELEDNQLITPENYVGKEAAGLTAFTRTLSAIRPASVIVLILLGVMAAVIIVAAVRILKDLKHKK